MSDRTERNERLRDDVIIGLVVGLATGGALFLLGNYAENSLADQQQRIENLRFVRERSSTDVDTNRPFRGLDLQGQNLSGLDLPEAKMVSADLEKSDLRFIHLQRAQLHTADLRQANLTSSSLFDTKFIDANLQDAQVMHSFAQEAEFTGADLNGTDFDGTALQAADFRGAKNLDKATLQGSCWDRTTKWPDGFQPPPSADPGSCPRP
ncbi:pentapeptide repeat-containing protein [Arthrobacter sp. USHLN218]|uniref:pentapeptide repeat-containing protein n=1 Tax=Arthrobacter sp. USHLN218 TaxID=3081232 RepID=UPI00301925DB